MKQIDPSICMGSRTLLEYWKARDGYWTSNTFMKQMGIALKIAEEKYLKEKGYRLFWIFNQNGCHMAHADGSLNVHHINAKERGSQPLMHDTIYNGKHISMTKVVKKPTGERVSIPRGMTDVLQQRGKYHPKMKVGDMRKELSSHPDFVHERNKLEYFLHSRCHACHFIPKYHCELNSIERC